MPCRIYIVRKDLEKNGCTQVCPACSEIMGGARQTGTLHTDPCPNRSKAAIGVSTNADRAKVHKMKVDGQLAARLQKSVESTAVPAPTPPGPIRLGADEVDHDEAMAAPVPMDVPSELAEAPPSIRGRDGCQV